jgi:hypothetical protein
LGLTSIGRNIGLIIFVGSPKQKKTLCSGGLGFRVGRFGWGRFDVQKRGVLTYIGV